MKEAPIEIARRILACATDQLEVMKIRDFHDNISGGFDDISAHDDTLQARLQEEFTESCEQVVAQLTVEFGIPELLDDRDSRVRLGGVFVGAAWGILGKTLYVVAAHEDRECPYLLVLGTSGNQPTG